MTHRTTPGLLVLALVGGLLAGCASGGSDDGDGDSGRPLEVPPDLTAPDARGEYEIPRGRDNRAATFSEYSGGERPRAGSGRDDVLPEVSSARLERQGRNRWLVVQGEPGAVWEPLRAFLEEQGFEIAEAEPRAGILITDWKGNPEDLREPGLGTIFSHILPMNDEPTRDKFHVRLERGAEPGTTEVYVAHHGVKQVASGDTTVWEPRPSDASLEAEMLARLMAYLDRDVEEDEARQQVADAEGPSPDVRLTQLDDGQPVLELRAGFARAWRVIGLVLDRRGFDVEDRNRADGVYYVRYRDPDLDEGGGGFFSWLAFWRDRPAPDVPIYRMVVDDTGTGSRVVVEDEAGEPAAAPTARRLLTVLEEELG